MEEEKQEDQNYGA